MKTLITLAILSTLPACGSSPTEAPFLESTTGGNVATGGSSATVSSTGGNAATGGNSATVSSTGGNATTGGSSATVSSTGGNATTGGSSATNTTSSTGGNTATGGNSATASSIGGNMGTGGSAAYICPTGRNCQWLTTITKSAAGNPTAFNCTTNFPYKIDSGPIPNPSTTNIIDTPSACASALTLEKVVTTVYSQLQPVSPTSYPWAYATGCRLVTQPDLDNSSVVSVMEFDSTEWQSWEYYPDSSGQLDCVNLATGSY